MPTALDILKAKTQVPSEMRTAEWDRVPVWIRERAFFMAGVQRAEVLDAFYRAAQEIADGKLSLAEARQELREQLKALDYAPAPGQEGTIKDLRTMRRMNVALETTVALVRGYSRWIRQQAALTSFPAQRLVRWRDVKEPRDWDARWDEAISATTPEGVTDIGEKVALVNHPIWTAISRFELPYPPFDFGSGMGIEPVDWETADSLGILPKKKGVTSPHEQDDLPPEDEELLEEMLEPQERGLNDTLQAHPDIESQELREALSDAMQGFAEWVDDAFIFTDPNGTRPYTAERLADVISAPLPEGFSGLQADALIEWAKDSARMKARPYLDKVDDFVRAILRTTPLESGIPLWRGEGFKTAHELAQRIEGFLSAGGLKTQSIGTSFSRDLSVAEAFGDLNGPHQLIINALEHQSARYIAPSVQKLFPAHGVEEEVLFPANVRFLIVAGPNVIRTPQGQQWHITVREVLQ